jgi:hypothetical protein
MLVAQALGEYGIVSALGDGLRSGRLYIEDLGHEWGLTGLAVAIAVAVVWKLITRVR